MTKFGIFRGFGLAGTTSARRSARPDYTRPLRMQHVSWRADQDGGWRLALRRRWVWRRALGISLGASAAYWVMIAGLGLGGMPAGVKCLQLLGVPLLMMAVSLMSVAGSAGGQESKRASLWSGQSMN